MGKGMSLAPILTKIIALALPITGGRLLAVGASFVALRMVAELGEISLAAGFLAATSSTTLFVLASSVFYAVGIRIRFYRGQHNASALIGNLVKNACFLAIMIATLTSIAIASMDKMLLVLGQAPELVALTHDYFRYAGIGIFPMLLMMVLGQFYVGIGKSYFTLVTGVMNLGLTVLFSYALVFGYWGMPQLGLGGVSLASLWAQTLILCGSFVFIYWTRIYHHYPLFKNLFALDWHLCRSILSLGIPMGVQAGGELIAMALANYLMGYYGVNALAALQIPSQYSLLVIMLSFGLAQALSCLVSEAYGKQEVNSDLIKKYLQASVVLLLSYLVPVSLVFATMPIELATFYMDTDSVPPEFAALLRAFFVLAAAFLFLDGLRHLLSSILRGLHDTKKTTQINLVAMWFVSLLVSCLLVFVFQVGPVALRVGFLSGFVVAVVVLSLHLYKKLQHTSNALRPWVDLATKHTVLRREL